MKKIILSLSFSVFVLLTYAQSGISIVHEGETDELNGLVYSKNAVGTGDQIVDLHVMNNTGSDLTLKITRVKLNTQEDWADYICWGIIGDPFGGTCYAASVNNPWVTPGLGKLIPNGQGGLLAIHIDPSDVNAGTGLYRYYVTANTTYLDSVDVFVNSGTSNIKENKSNAVILSSFPNPASEILNVNLQSSSTEGYLKITDVLGKVVYDEKIVGSKKINVEEFKNGVYILNLTSNGTKTTKRIVVKH